MEKFHLKSANDIVQYLITHTTISLRKVATYYKVPVRDIYKEAHALGFELMVETEFSNKHGEYSVLKLKRRTDKIFNEIGDELFPCMLPKKLFETSEWNCNKGDYICYHGHQCYHSKENCEAGMNGVIARENQYATITV